MDEVAHLLGSTLSPDANLRVAAELRLAHLALESETGLSLARIATNSTLDIHLRQISHSRNCSRFSLKKYVKEHWSPFFQTFKAPPATSVEVKAEIRTLIFGGLSDPVRKIRLACAAIISDIAHPDWPDDWPTLMSQLLQLISGTSDEVDGGMRVLNDFVGIDLTEDQLLPLARDMLPQLLVILGSPETHSPSTRARGILIFRQCVMTLFTVKDEHPEAVKGAVSEIVPRWINAFRQLLEGDLTQELAGDSWESLAIRTAIYNTLEIIMNSFPSVLKPSLPHFLQLSTAHLGLLLPVYHAHYLSDAADATIPTSVEEDSNVPSDLPGLVSSMIDFLTQAARRKGCKDMFIVNGAGTPLLDQSMVVSFAFSQMTIDDEETWTSDPNAFVADEDDEMILYNVRAASIDFVLALIDTYDTVALKSLWSAFETRAASSDAARSRGEEDWWKGYEGALSVIGAVATDVLEHVQSASEDGVAPAFDLGVLFSSIIPAYLTAADLPFLQGRSFVFASQFAKALPVDLATQYIDAAIQVLESVEAGVPVKVSAVRALNNFFRHLHEAIDPARAEVTMTKLLPLLPQTTENTMVLLVETLESTLKVGGATMQFDSCTALIAAVLATWFEKPEDPMLGSAVCELFQAFAGIATPVVEQNLLHVTLPALARTMTEIRTDPYSSRASAAVDIIDNIFDGRPLPLGEGMFAVVGDVLFEVLASSDDRDLLQSGLHIITTVVRKEQDQILSWRDTNGRSGLELILALVARLLEPSESESGGLFVGDLVIQLIRKAGPHLGPVLPDLLKAFVVRLATAQTASFSQSLILPFAYLVHTQAGIVLDLLEGIVVPAAVPGAADRSGLEVLLTTWCENVDVFQGYWNLKVSSVALTQLYLSPRESLRQIKVKGDLLLTAANSNGASQIRKTRLTRLAIMTRARAKNNPDQFPAIPFYAKALKVLLHDVQNSGGDEATFGGKAGAMDPDAESDDGDDEWADDGAEFLTDDKDLDFLSDMLGGGSGLSGYLNENGSDDAFDDRADEADLKDDPVYQLDLQAHLLAFFKQSYETDINSFRQLAEQYLSTPEKEVLAQVLQS